MFPYYMKMETTNDNNVNQNYNYNCYICDYNTSKLFLLNQHLKTKKHLIKMFQQKNCLKKHI